MVRAQTLGDLVLVADRPFQETHRRDAGKDPGKFGDLGNILLGKKGAVLGVKAKGKEVQGHAQRVLTQQRGVLDRGKSVVAGDEVEGLVALLQGDVLARGPEVVAQMGPARGLYAGEYAHGSTSLEVVGGSARAPAQRPSVA